MTKTYAGLTIALPEDVASAAEKAAAVRDVVKDVLQTHDAAFRVALESEGPSLDTLAGLSRDGVDAAIGHPIRYALVSLLPPDSADVDVSLSGRPRRIRDRVLVEVFCAEEGTTATQWLDLVASLRPDRPGVLAAFQHGSTLVASGRLGADGIAAPDAHCQIAAPEGVQVYRGGFGKDSVACHVLRFTLPIT